MSQAVGLSMRSRDERVSSPAHRMALRLPAVGLLVLLGVQVLLASNAVRVVRAGVTAVAYPFELDFAEGLVLTQTRALAVGRSIYPPADALPATVSNYAPVYYAVVALVGGERADHLAVGRSLSLASALLAAAALALLTWRALEPALGRLVRFVAAVCAGLAFLQVSYAANFIALMRVDLLAVLLAYLGVVVFSATAARGRQVYWCLVPLVLALFTKQTTVAAAGACIVTAARVDRRRGLQLGAAFAAVVLLVAAALQVVTRGGFFFHVVSGNLHPFSWSRAASFLQDVAVRYPVLVALAAAITPSLLAPLPSTGGSGAAARAEARGWTRATLGAYLPLAALTALGAGKLGAEVNYLIELMGVVCVGAAVAVGEALRPLRAAAIDRTRSGSAVAALAVPLLLVWQVCRLAPAGSIELIETPSAAEQAQVADLVELVRHTDGPVLSEDLTLLERAHKPVLFQPFDITQLIYRRLRDERPVLAALERGDFRLVVLRFDVAHPTPMAFNRFTPGMIEAIRSRYLPRASLPGHWVYAPRTAAARPSTEGTP